MALQQVTFSCMQSNSSQTWVREPTPICCHVPVSADWGFRLSHSWLKYWGALGWLTLTFWRKPLPTSSGKPIYLPWKSISSKSLHSMWVPFFLSFCFHWNSSLHILRFSFISLLKLWNTFFFHFSNVPRSSYSPIYQFTLHSTYFKFSPFPLLILLPSPDLYYQTIFSSYKSQNILVSFSQKRYNAHKLA